MKRCIVLLFSFLLITNIGVAQNGWVEQNSGVTQQLSSVSGTLNSTPNIAWICGYAGIILRTTNYGAIWQNVSSNRIPDLVVFASISAVDGNIAIAAGNIGTSTVVYRTTNAGANWDQVFEETGGFIDAVCMSTVNNGFMAGDPAAGSNRWSLWKTTNGGANWDSSGLYLVKGGSNEAGWNNAMFCLGNKIWLGTNNSRIYYSTNNGANWILESTGSEVNSYAIWFNANGLDGLAGGGTLLITSTGGISWNTQTYLGVGGFGGITGMPPILDNQASLNAGVWCVNSDSRIFFSSNNAQNWQVDYTAQDFSMYRYIARTFTNGPLYAVRASGGITYHSPIVGFQPTGTWIPSSFSLLQNYPDPFNPVTKIKFDISKTSFTRIIIYDILGKEAATILYEELKPGTYSVDWDGSNYASGIYFYKLSAGDFTETKKMILMK